MTENLAQEFLRLSAERRKRVHQILCSEALNVWARFSAQEDKLTYADSVVGLVHEVDFQLPIDAFRAAFTWCSEDKSDAIAQRYLEPISALQDSDLEFPEPVLMGYYAIYNAFCKYARQENTDDWLIVNQALATDVNNAREMLNSALRQAT